MALFLFMSDRQAAAEVKSEELKVERSEMAQKALRRVKSGYRQFQGIEENLFNLSGTRGAQCHERIKTGHQAPEVRHGFGSNKYSGLKSIS